LQLSCKNEAIKMASEEQACEDKIVLVTNGTNLPAGGDLNLWSYETLLKIIPVGLFSLTNPVIDFR